MTRAAWALAASLVWLGALGCNRPTDLPPGDPARPDVVVVSIDTLRADHLGAYGYERPTSPFLDALAARGARFASAWAPSPWTLPSHATLLSGWLPRRHGAIEGDRALAEDTPLVQRAFAEAGFVTGAFVTSVFVSQRYGFERGFERFADFEIRDARKNLAKSVPADQVLDAALAWARAQEPGRPIFLFLHLYDVHYAYDPPPPWNERFDRPPQAGDARYRRYAFHRANPLDPAQMAHQVAQYDEEIAWVDDRLGAFHTAWTARRPAVFSISSDHGEEFGERGSWGHAHTLFPEQLHVPWIVAGPGIATVVVGERVGLEDVAPTLAALAGVPWPAAEGERGFDGTDRSARLRGGAPEPGDTAARFADTSRFDTLVYRWHESPHDLHVDLRAGTRLLCDLEDDPTCTRDRAAERAETSERMEDALFAWLGEPWEARTAGTVETDGILVVNGRPVGSRVEARAGLRFAVHPADAEATFTTAGDRLQLDPSKPPAADAPVRLHARAGGSAPVALGEDERRRLEALGYAQ